MVAEGAIHAVRLKQKSKIKRKKKIAAAIYEYQADGDGEWGEISLDFENGSCPTVRCAQGSPEGGSSWRDIMRRQRKEAEENETDE